MVSLILLFSSKIWNPGPGTQDLRIQTFTTELQNPGLENRDSRTVTAQKMKFSIKGFFSKCDQICRKLRIWSHLSKKSLIENFNRTPGPKSQTYVFTNVWYSSCLLSQKAFRIKDILILCSVFSLLFFRNMYLFTELQNKTLKREITYKKCDNTKYPLTCFSHIKITGFFFLKLSFLKKYFQKDFTLTFHKIYFD